MSDVRASDLVLLSREKDLTKKLDIRNIVLALTLRKNRPVPFIWLSI